MSLAGCQINPIDVNFHSADKVWSENDRGWKVPCLMPIRVKVWAWFIFDLGSRPNSFIFFFETRKIRIFIVINDYWQFKTLIFFRNGMEKKPYPQLFFRPPLPTFIFLCSSLGFFIDRDRAVHKKTLLFPWLEYKILPKYAFLFY